MRRERLRGRRLVSSGACNAGWVVIRNLPLPDLGLVNARRLGRIYGLAPSQHPPEQIIR
jgi:hypothetical protein